MTVDRRKLTVPAVALALTLLAACGGEDDDRAESSTTSPGENGPENVVDQDAPGAEPPVTVDPTGAPVAEAIAAASTQGITTVRDIAWHTVRDTVWLLVDDGGPELVTYEFADGELTSRSARIDADDRTAVGGVVLADVDVTRVAELVQQAEARTLPGYRVQARQALVWSDQAGLPYVSVHMSDPSTARPGFEAGVCEIASQHISLAYPDGAEGPTSWETTIEYLVEDEDADACPPPTYTE